MENIILNFPKQLAVGLELGKGAKITPPDFENIIICGMGGSVIAGEMLATQQSADKILPRIFINRDYDLPEWAGNKDLVICISWSGNTEETISSFESATKKGLATIAITENHENDKLAQLAKSGNSKLVLLPKEDIPPRFAAGYMLGALLGVLGLNQELNFQIDAATLEKEGQELASKIGNRIPVIYASFKWRKLANFWKAHFNENAKVPAFWNAFPALAHNEIESYEKDSNLFPIIIRDDNDDARQNKNIDAAIALFDKLGYNYSIIAVSPTGKVLEKVLKNYILGLWTSLYLAKNLGVEPLKTRVLDEFKRFKTV